MVTVLLELRTEKYKTSFLKNMSNAQRRILWGKLAFALEMCIAESFKLSGEQPPRRMRTRNYVGLEESADIVPSQMRGRTCTRNTLAARTRHLLYYSNDS
jgi:hypothetical protein